jgi:hypothetical protein
MANERTPMKFSNGGGLFMGNVDATSAPVTDGFSTIESLNENAQTMGLTDEKDIDLQALEYQGAVAYVNDRYERAKEARYTDEHRWLKAYENYRGLNDSPEMFQQKEKSKLFIKISKTKALAAHSQVCDVLFSQNKFPLGVEPTPVPDGIEESVHFDPKDPANQQQGQPQGKIPTARQSIAEGLGPVLGKLEPVKDKLKPGPGASPSAITYEPAKMAARKLDKKFQDMLEEADAIKALDRMVLDMAIFGTGIFKGPMTKAKDYSSWDEEGNYVPKQRKIADFQYVNLWDAYPDPEARFTHEMSYFVQRYKMNRSQLRDLKKRPYFMADAIEKVIEQGPNYKKEYWEHTLEDNVTEVTPETFEVLEFWGIVDKQIAKDAEIEIPPEYKDYDEVQVNIWVCNNYIIRFVFNPFIPARIPYFIVPYEIHPFSIFGIGVVENMEDSQQLMNGSMRMAIDNAVLSGHNIFEVNTTFLTPGQDMEIYPGKIFYSEGPQGQAIRDIKFQNVTNENFMVFDKARQLADESTGIPSYSHGQSGIQSVGRTAAGMSMLMGASALNIKNVIRNVDEYLLVPLGKAMHAYLMQFEFDKEYIGDIEIMAKGTASLMRNEVRAQKILQALQVTGNPMDAPFTRRDYLLRELMDSLDIDADKAVNDPREAVLQAEAMKALMLAQGIDPNKPQGSGGTGNPSGVPSPNDPTQTGGGNISPGGAPPPGAQGNTGAGGGANGGNTQNRPGNGPNGVRPQ